MLKNELYRNIKKPINILWPIAMFFSWFLGTNMIRKNIKGLGNAISAIINNSNQNSGALEVFQKQLDAISGYMVFAEGYNNFYISIVAISLAGLIYSSGFTYDKNTGYGCMIITRNSFRKYFIEKMLCCFLCPFICVFLCSIAVFVISLLVFSSTPPSLLFNFSMIEGAKTTQWFINSPIIATFFMIFNLSFFTGFYSLLGACVSLISSNRFLISITPLAIYIFNTLIPQLFNINSSIAKIFAWIFPSYSMGLFIGNTYWYSDFSFEITYMLHIVVIVIPTMLLLILLYCMNKKQYIK